MIRLDEKNPDDNETNKNEQLDNLTGIVKRSQAAPTVFYDCQGSAWEQMTDGWHYQAEWSIACFNLSFV